METDNVLDLKDQEPGQAEADAVAEAQKAAQASEESNPADLAALALGSLLGPQAIAWEAQHTLSDNARRRHYMVLAAFGIVGSAVALWQSSWLTFLVVVIGLIAWEARERFAKPVQVAIDDRGLIVDGHHYPHTELTSFDIQQMPDDTIELSVKTTRWHLPHLRLPLGDQSHEEVRAVLSQYIVYDRHPMPRIDYWIRK